MTFPENFSNSPAFVLQAIAGCGFVGGAAWHFLPAVVFRLLDAGRVSELAQGFWEFRIGMAITGLILGALIGFFVASTTPARRAKAHCFIASFLSLALCAAMTAIVLIANGALER
jgi:hypothetical protein